MSPGSSRAVAQGSGRPHRPGPGTPTTDSAASCLRPRKWALPTVKANADVTGLGRGASLGFIKFLITQIRRSCRASVCLKRKAWTGVIRSLRSTDLAGRRPGTFSCVFPLSLQWLDPHTAAGPTRAAWPPTSGLPQLWALMAAWGQCPSQSGDEPEQAGDSYLRPRPLRPGAEAEEQACQRPLCHFTPCPPRAPPPRPAVSADVSSEEEVDRPARPQTWPLPSAPGARGGSASSSAEDAWAPGCLTPETGSPRSGLPSLAHPPQGTPSATPRAMSSLLCSVPSAGRGLLSLHGQHQAPSRGPSQKKRSHSRALTHSPPVPGTLWGLPGSGRGRR